MSRCLNGLFAMLSAGFLVCATSFGADPAIRAATTTDDKASGWLQQCLNMGRFAGAKDACAGTALAEAPEIAGDKGWLAMVGEPADKAKASSRPDDGRADNPDASQETAEDLAKKTQNPVADLISLPFQSNFNFYDIHTHLGCRNYDRHTMGYLLNVQPVVPFKLSKDWSVITRTIIPIVNQPQLFPGMGSHGGLGKLFYIGKLPVNASLAAYYNVDYPTSGPAWNVRFQIQFLFPK